MRILLTCLILGLSAPALLAQEGGPATRDTMQGDAQLLAAIQLASEGQADSARAIIRRRLMTTPTTDPVFPEILYSAGVVAGNADSAMLYLRRVSERQSGWSKTIRPVPSWRTEHSGRGAHILNRTISTAGAATSRRRKTQQPRTSSWQIVFATINSAVPPSPRPPATPRPSIRTNRGESRIRYRSPRSEMPRPPTMSRVNWPLKGISRTS